MHVGRVDIVRTFVLLPRLRLFRRVAAAFSMFLRATSKLPLARGREPSLLLVGAVGDVSLSGSGDSKGANCGFGMLARRSSVQILLSSRLSEDLAEVAGGGRKPSPSPNTPATDTESAAITYISHDSPLVADSAL